MACALCLSQGAWAQTPLAHSALVAQDSISAADTAWMMTSTALVLLMTLPGIALFCGGMVRKKNVLNTMASVVAIAALLASNAALPHAGDDPQADMAPYVRGLR